MRNKIGLIIYYVLCVCVTVAAILVFRHSMNEPFEVITKTDLVWQLILPAMFLSLSIVGVVIAVLSKFGIGKLMIGASLLILCLDSAIFLEAIYGYMWDLKVHVGIA